MVNNYDVAVLSEKVAYLEGAVLNLTDASGISYDNTESGLTADDVQGAIDELAEASGIAYDNTDSGLTADDVQGALDEVAGELETETATIVTKAIMSRNGKNRFLILDSITVTDEGGTIITLPEGDRPTTAFGVLGRWYDTSNKYHPCFISVLTNGEVKASSILSDGTAGGISNGTIIGSISYIL